MNAVSFSPLGFGPTVHSVVACPLMKPMNSGQLPRPDCRSNESASIEELDTVKDLVL
jgi:hypothetical protein